MRLTYDGGLWAAALSLTAMAIVFAARSFEGALLDGAYLVVASGALAAACAFFTNGLTRSPVLALSVPMLAGWWAATSFSTAGAAGVGLAALLGLASGVLISAAATTSVRRTAAITLALAVLADVVSDGFAFDSALGAPAIDSGPWLGVLALIAVALGWRAEASLAAALLAARADGEPSALGVASDRLLIFAGAIGGTAGGLAGALLAIGGGGPPDVVTGLVLAVAALAVGGTMAGTLALVMALWVLPQLALRATPTTVDLQLWLAAGVAVVLLLLSLQSQTARTARG